MQILCLVALLLYSKLIMSFRSFPRLHMNSLRTTVRMMSDEPRTFVDYTLHKTKGALNFKPVAATLKDQGGRRTIDRQGAMLLEFAAPSGGAGTKGYDWTKKQLFSLKVAEMAQIIRLSETGSLTLTHNPNLSGKQRVDCRRANVGNI
jgi:hypothetical protein